MENNEIEILVNSYCDLMDEKNQNMKEFFYTVCNIESGGDTISIKKYYNNIIHNIEYELYQISKKLHNIDDMYDNANSKQYRKSNNINIEIKDREILIEHYISVKNNKKIISLLRYDFNKLTNDIRHIIIKYIQKEKYDEEYEYKYDYIFPLGKYKNELAETVIKNDINYIKWYVKNMDMPYDSRKQLFKLSEKNN